MMEKGKCDCDGVIMKVIRGTLTCIPALAPYKIVPGQWFTEVSAAA
jgi:hypothetical protein